MGFVSRSVDVCAVSTCDMSFMSQAACSIPSSSVTKQGMHPQEITTDYSRESQRCAIPLPFLQQGRDAVPDCHEYLEDIQQLEFSNKSCSFLSTAAHCALAAPVLHSTWIIFHLRTRIYGALSEHRREGGSSVLSMVHS